MERVLSSRFTIIHPPSPIKWAKLAKCSQDTAYRDILDLIEHGALKKDSGGGRSTSYSLLIERTCQVRVANS